VTIDELIENRLTAMLEWPEPWPAIGPDGNDVSAHITLRATVNDCINLSRSAAKAGGRPTSGNDADLLQEFMAVHWATIDVVRDQFRSAIRSLPRLLAKHYIIAHAAIDDAQNYDNGATFIKVSELRREMLGES
jgi:hypothetical protein